MPLNRRRRRRRQSVLDLILPSIAYFFFLAKKQSFSLIHTNNFRNWRLTMGAKKKSIISISFHLSNLREENWMVNNLLKTFARKSINRDFTSAQGIAIIRELARKERRKRER